MALTLDGTNGLTFNDTSLQGAAASPYVLKNRIINGAMVIDQRNAGALVNPAVADYTVDRWYYYQTQTSKGTIGQNAGSVTPPVGFKNYLGFTSTSAYSVTATDIFFIGQFIEGYNVADLDFGTANAKTVTLSFWVRSSLTGTFGGVLANSAGNRTYPFTYTIISANTWEQKSITVVGDTTGTWLTTTGRGLCVDFGLGVGSTYSGTAGAWTSTSFITSATGATSVVAVNGATFYITGVQLEQNTVATPFERRLYDKELISCQRYYYKINSSVAYGLMGWGQGKTTSIVRINVPLPVTMRVPATGFDYSAANTYFLVSGSNNPTVSSVSTSTNSSLQIAQLEITTGTSATVSAAYDLFANVSAAAYIGVIAEL